MKNYYEILQVNENASQEIIEKAYKVLVKKYHPDLQDGDKSVYAEEVIKNINEAYEVLSDNFLREQYNIELQKDKKRKIEKLYGKQEEKVSPEKTKKNEKKTDEKVADNKKNKVGTLDGIIDIIKVLLKNKPKREEIKEVTKKDFVALGLTVVVILVIGVILWFIPFTNSWMRELLFENVLFSWIFK